MAILSTYPDKSSLNGNERLATSDDDGSVKLAAASLLKEFTNTDPVVKSGGAYKAGLLKSDASGNVTVGKATSDDLDFTTFPSNSSWDSGWINVTFQNGYSNQNGTTVSYRKIGGVVYLRGQPGKTTIDTNVMFTLPIGYRPALDSVYTCPSAAVNVGKLAINSNGEVRCVGTPASGNYVALDVVNFVSA